MFRSIGHNGMGFSTEHAGAQYDLKSDKGQQVAAYKAWCQILRKITSMPGIAGV